MLLQLRPVLAAVGTILYAVAGGVIGAQNADWLGPEWPDPLRSVHP